MDKLFKTVPCILRINLSLAVLLQGIFYLKCLCNIRFETNSNWKAVPLYISGIGTLQMLKQPITLPGIKGVSQWYALFAKPPAAWRNSQKMCHGFLIFFNLSLTIISNLHSIDNFKRNHLGQDTLFVGCVSGFFYNEWRLRLEGHYYSFSVKWKVKPFINLYPSSFLFFDISLVPGLAQINNQKFDWPTALRTC